MTPKQIVVWEPAVICVAVLVCLAPGAVSAQDVAIVRGGDLHLEGFGGFNFVGGVNRVSTTALGAGLTPAQLLTPNTNGNVGARADYSFTRHFGIEAEYSLVAGGSLSFNQDFVLDQSPPRLQRVAVSAHSSAQIGSGAMVFRFPWERFPRLVPYIVAGAGVVRTHFALKQAVVGDSPGQTFSGSDKANDMVGLGATGARYYFTERLGLSADLRVFAGPNTRTLGRLAIGVFYKAH